MLTMETRYFNIEALTNLIGEDRKVLIGMLEGIITGALQKYDLLNTNFLNQDWDLVKDNAHFLKSNFRYLGNLEMSTILKAIEINSLDSNRRVEVKGLLKEFNDTFPLVIKEVEDYVNYLKN